MRLLPSFLLIFFLSIHLENYQVSSERILVLSFISSKSHKITYMRLIEELAKRGHDVTVVTPVRGKETKNIREVLTIDIEKLEKELEGKFDPFKIKESGTKMNPFMFLDLWGDLCEKMYDLPQVRALLNEKFDLIFMQPMFNDCALGMVYRLKAPLVLFAPISAPSILVNKLGGHFPPSFVPSPFIGYPDEMTFLQRFMNFGSTMAVEAILKFYYEPYMTRIYRDKLGQDIPTASEILSNASLILSNGHFSWSRPKPYLPDVIDVGGIHSRPAEPLPKDLQDFVSKSGKEGFILFSMGSAIKGDQMSEAKRKLFLSVFSKLKQQVLWKWESETMPDLPKNVKLSKWLPQQDLLGHSGCRLFITHCGGGGTEEAIYHGVPLVGMPMFGDQDMNAMQALNLGFLYQLEWNDLTEDELHKAIQEVLNNQKYRDNVQKLSKIFKDQPNDPLQRGVYWVEYVLRHKGAPQLRSASRNLYWFQYHSLDVIGAYLGIVFGSLYIIFATLRWICRKICCCGGTKKQIVANKQMKKKNQ